MSPREIDLSDFEDLDVDDAVISRRLRHQMQREESWRRASRKRGALGMSRWGSGEPDEIDEFDEYDDDEFDGHYDAGP